MGRDIRGERICGARVEVCFGSWDEREGLGLDSFMGSSDQNSPCQCRRLDAANGNCLTAVSSLLTADSTVGACIMDPYRWIMSGTRVSPRAAPYS